MNENNGKQSIAAANRQNRRMILWIVCGGYLLYLAYQLGRGLAQGEVQAGTETVISVAGCVVFAIVGAALLILAARTGLQSFRSSLEAMDEAEQEREAGEGETGESGGDVPALDEESAERTEPDEEA